MTSKSSILFFAAAICLTGFGVFECPATNTYYVATNGTGNGDSWEAATNSIQGAIDRTSSGDIVLVSNGVYDVGGVTNIPAGSLLTNRVAITNAITVRSANNDPTNTIIKGAGPNGDGAVRCVYLADGASLIGFTLTNGATRSQIVSWDYFGGGAACQSTAATISNCLISGNTAYYSGGGVYLGTLYNCLITNSSLTYSVTIGGGAAGSILYDCTLAGNSSGGGGGGYGGAVDHCTLSNCTLSGNTAYSLGGGAMDSTLYNCKVTGGYAIGGGGVFRCTVYNSLIVGAAAQNGGGASGGAILHNCTLSENFAYATGGGVYDCTLSNCISWNNNKVDVYTTGTGAYYSCGLGYSGNNNINSDPLFVNAAGGNYRIRAGSPCINMGTNESWTTNAYDLGGRARIRYDIVDMGAYEWGPITHYVAHGGQTPAGTFTNWSAAASNIQDAINVSIDDDIVSVSNGVYDVGGLTNCPAGTLLTNRVAITNATTVRSANNDPTNTIIKGGSSARCAYLSGGATLIGFTLTNGTATGSGSDNYGGGAYVDSGVMSNCLIVGNSCSGGGGGLNGAGSTLYDCRIANNTALAPNGSGGGLYNAGTLYRCTIANNQAPGALGYGGGLYMATALYNCTLVSNYCFQAGGGALDCAVMYNCLIVGNWTGIGTGGGVCNGGPLYNSTISGNSAPSGGGVSSAANRYNCISWGNSTSDTFPSNSFYSCGVGYGDYPANHNISADPHFADSAHGNFRLQAGSPCIDMGTNGSWTTNAIDLDRRPRVKYGVVDMGAYEYIRNGAFFGFR